MHLELLFDPFGATARPWSRSPPSPTCQLGATSAAFDLVASSASGRCNLGTGFPGRRTTTGASDARGRETELLLHAANPLPLRLRDLRPVPLPSPLTGSNALLHRVALSSQKSDIDSLFPFPYIGHYDNMSDVRLEREPGGQPRVALAKGARPRAAGSVMAHHGQTPGPVQADELAPLRLLPAP
jgi:hypothetical protein